MVKMESHPSTLTQVITFYVAPLYENFGLSLKYGNVSLHTCIHRIKGDFGVSIYNLYEILRPQNSNEVQGVQNCMIGLIMGGFEIAYIELWVDSG